VLINLGEAAYINLRVLPEKIGELINIYSIHCCDWSCTANKIRADYYCVQ
jgi:hypothetical protein